MEFSYSNQFFNPKNIRWVINGKIHGPERLEVPKEFDFFKLWCGKDPINAKKYYAQF